MRRRAVLVGWAAQTVLAIGLAVSVVAAAASPGVGSRWDFLLVMGITLFGATVAWAVLRFAPALVVVDAVHALLGLGIWFSGLAAGTADGLQPARLAVGVLWIGAGVVGAVAVWRSYPLRGDARDDVDTPVGY